MLQKKVLKLFMTLVFIFASGFFGCSKSIHPDFINCLTNDIKETRKNQTFESIVVSLTYDDENKRLIVGRESGDLEIWDMTKNVKRTIPKAHQYRANRVQFTPDGEGFFSSTTFRGELKFWDTRTGELLYSVSGFCGPVIYTGTRHLYLMVETSEMHFFDSRKKTMLHGTYRASGSIRSIAVDKKTGLVATGTASGSIDLFRIEFVEKKPYLVKIKEIEPYEAGNWVQAVHFSPDAKHLYSVSRTGKIDQWSVPALEKEKSRNTSKGSVPQAKFFPGKELLALAEVTAANMVEGDYFLELISLSSGRSGLTPLTTNLGVVEFIPSLGKVVVISGRTVKTVDFPEDHPVSP